MNGETRQLGFSSARMVASVTAELGKVMDKRSEEMVVAGIGSYRAAVDTVLTDGAAGGAKVSASASIALITESDSLSVEISTKATPPTYGRSTSQGDIQIEFSVGTATVLDIGFDAQGKYSLDLVRVSDGAQIYSVSRTEDRPGSKSSETRSVSLDSGSYTLQALGMPFDANAGVRLDGVSKIWARIPTIQAPTNLRVEDE